MTSVDPSTSRFTAVNSVKELTPNTPSAVFASGNTSNVPRSESEKIPLNQSGSTPHTHEKLTLITSYPNHEESSSSSNCGEGTLGPLSESRGEEENHHKRKRSTSKCNNPYYNHSESSSTRNGREVMPTKSDLARDENPRPQVQVVDTREIYSLDSQFKQYPSPAEEHDPPTQDVAEPWNLQHVSQPAQPTSNDLMETKGLQRVAQTLNHPPTHQHSKTPRMDRNMKGHPPLETKKRKRNFSNRTKTGCMTCRKRKKKCDETKPECNNCLRGGFVCTGYQQRGSLTKPDQNSLPPQPQPLQSKSEYEMHSSPYPSSAQYLSPSTGGPLFREPVPGYRGQTLRIDSQQNHNLLVQSGHPSSISCYPPSTVNTYHVNADACLSSIPLFQQIPTPITATNSAYPDRNVKNICDRVIPPNHVNRLESRIEPKLVTPQSTSSPSIPKIFHSPRHVDPHKHPQITAQLALSSLTSTNNSCPPKVDTHIATSTQKEEMLAGHHYFPWDKQLIQERENCKGACWRFNSSSNPHNGISFEERARLFRDILYPRQVGDDVIVDAPFNCDYGYNIIIGHDVMIGRNCTIVDTCEVHIGDRCHIGPNVNIYTASLPINPKKRLGSKGPQLGRKVIIESDCWIGGGVIILPGRTIGKGATIGAGSVVTKDIPPHTIARGNPAHVLRGISESE